MMRSIERINKRCLHKQTSQMHGEISEESENKFSGFPFLSDQQREYLIVQSI